MVERCPECEGKGTVNQYRHSQGGDLTTIGYCPKQCPQCYGIGAVPTSNDKYVNSLHLKLEIIQMIAESEEGDNHE